MEKYMETVKNSYGYKASKKLFLMVIYLKFNIHIKKIKYC